MNRTGLVTLRRLLLTASTLSLAALLQSCCCNCPTGANKVAFKNVCQKLEAFGGDSDAELESCLDEMELFDSVDDEFHECIVTCDDHASGSKEILGRCVSNCTNSLDRDKIPMEAEVKVKGNNATISVKTFSNVHVKIRSASKKIDGKKKTSNKKGSARFKLKKLKPGQYTATLTTSLKSQSGSFAVSFKIEAPPIVVSAYIDKNVKAETLLCTINVRDSKSRPIQVKNVLGNIEKDFYLYFNARKRGRVTVEDKSVRSIRYKGKTRKAKKGKAAFGFKRSDIKSEKPARDIFSSQYGSLSFGIKHRSLGKLNAIVSCQIEKARAFRSGVPMLFKGESASDPKGGAAVVVDKGRVVRVIGPSRAKARDVAFFVEIDRNYKGTGNCRYKTSAGRVVNVERNTVKDTVKITDRRTGRTVANKTFSGGRASCPSTVTAGTNYVFGSRPSQTKIDAFVDRTLAKRR